MNRYYSLSCNCRIEIRKCCSEENIIITLEKCPYCDGEVKMQYFEHVLTPGYSTYPYSFECLLKEVHD